MLTSDMPSEKDIPDVTEAELAVMERVWSTPDVTIRAIADELYPGGGVAHYTTVQKLIERLEAKDFLRRDNSQMAHRFTAIVGREELIGRRLRAMAEKLCGGSMTPLLTSLVESSKLTAKEFDELRELIDKVSRKRKRS